MQEFFSCGAGLVGSSSVPGTSSISISFDSIFVKNANISNSPDVLGFPVAQMVKNLPVMQETQVPTLGWEGPLEKGMATHSRILA